MIGEPSGTESAAFRIKVLRPAEYEPTFEAMRAFTEVRGPDTMDEIWLCEHPPIYTLGLAGKPEHVLAPHGIPVVHIDRGGQVTYHGPGQVVAYVLMDLRRRGYFVRQYVQRIERAVMATLADFGLAGQLVDGAPGVYVHAGPAIRGDVSSALSSTPDFTGLQKISALGVKVRNHCTYHGVALNVAMDLKPFDGINPCGYAGLKTADFSTMGIPITVRTWEDVAMCLARHLESELAP